MIVQEYTSYDPITMIGREASICYGSDGQDDNKCYQRGIECLNNNHGRTLEYPQVYLVLSGYSARAIRELYTHIGGSPTRLQASTRYIPYGCFQYVTPDTVISNENATKQYDTLMQQIADTYGRLIRLGIPKEDAANVLPLGMTTQVVYRTNLRHLIEIMEVRQCTRAYAEIRDMMIDIAIALSKYSPEWEDIVNYWMPCKCEKLGYCPEGKKSCGLYPTKD